MLFFRSEELARSWCASKSVPLRPLVTLEQLWGLATTWYGSRLTPDSRRPQATEMRSIFAGLGLNDDFWDPHSDAFGAA